MPPTQTSARESAPTNPSKVSKFLSHINPHKHSEKNDDVPPRLQEAINQMNERKASKLEEMEQNGQKPNTKTSQAHAFEWGAALN
ncbi:hypothetical protein K505DRAFT_373583 [Melanomma pulvis-pyrius CBS 109.77]|uniref:Uncharacterized protein n=1 Tax=Melanomma pulvis-pyrius CBS 109.77 TaxID=1314802 RepID=A0A6A6XJ41_9PLEO|nr:hypothetical protein K505DRAFT_373583 [Melanomma pulvis-pyrius CBS 109.77]